MESNNVLKLEYLDILYHGRNKDYGGYPLRKKYNRRTVVSAIITIVLALIVVLFSFIKSPVEVVMNDEFVVTNVIITPPPLDAEVLPPPPPPAPPAPVKPTKKITPPIVLPNEHVRIEDLPDQILPGENVEVGLISMDGVDSPDAIPINLASVSGTGIANAIETTTTEEEIIHRVVEVMPEFPGGERALMRYLQNNIQYPQEARRNGIEGIAYLEFIVQADGSISNVKIIRDPGSGLGHEASRVVKKMPKWKAGRQNNSNVSVYFSLPINFTLQ